MEKSVARQRSLEAEQREFELNARKLQRELQQQAEFLKEQLTKQEGETEAVRRELLEREEAANQAKEAIQEELRLAYDKAQGLQERLGMLTEEKDALEKAATVGKLRRAEDARLNAERQEALRQKEEELQQLQVHLQEHLARIEEFSSRESAYIAEAERLREDIAALELGLEAEKEETQRLLAIKDEERRQVELAQQEALAAMQEQIDELKKARNTLLDDAAETEYCKLRQEYDTLLETVKRLRDQNSSLRSELDNAQSAHKDETQTLVKRHEDLLQNFKEAQNKYEELQTVLERNTAEYRRSLEDAQRQLAELKPQIEQMTAKHQKEEEELRAHLQQLEETRSRLQEEVSELRRKNDEAERLLREAEERGKQGIQAETQEIIDRLLTSLEEQQRHLKEADERQKGSECQSAIVIVMCVCVIMLPFIGVQRRGVQSFVLHDTHVLLFSRADLMQQLEIAQKNLVESKAAKNAILDANEKIRLENEGLRVRLPN